ncbi:anaerobic ribonucleoside triphosphate reductase [Paenibacillus sp. FSL K6-1122]|uniref:anaerobic ribonucleoside triphosphate reductase n=1 Tax=Paenibacillus TaxID=44249 RepID=UPI0003E1C688|nr:MULTISPECIES: anaerobic ribonucleoside triphosphate reductase [Paenibacillus]ETT49065.1 Oxygen-sensitive ribonucleoside-triphosphate reductase [Paenibacillus sp. FSL H7-689]OMF40560.1 anaerobic ribonucleoside-triphosphate reductase [Paenibacillus amylolyticus]PKQ92267.1 anaerobic ribonucleoside triphosphate reductase [Paenibacillus sp. BGI2013]
MNMLEYATPLASDLLSDLGRRIIGAEDADTLRENANLNGDSFSGKMSRLGSETAKWHALRHVLPEELAQAVENGDLYVHDLDQYALGTTNCIFIPFDRLLAAGFNTGNGSVRTPQTIMSAMALVAIIFQSQQNSQYGGVSANKIDWDLAPYVQRSFRKHYRKGQRLFGENVLIGDEQLHLDSIEAKNQCPRAYAFAYEETELETGQAAESLIHNLNTMSSRAGGQIPFTSLNYGLCTSAEGRLVSRSLLEATIRGLGNGETPVFPQHIFQCKQGINQAQGEPNYDLFRLAVTCSSRRMYPNFVNVDASFNLPFYHPEDPDTIIATMGCRTRTLADRFGRNRQSGKGNLSFNTINLVKLGIRFGICQGARAVADRAGFYTALESVMHNAASGLLHRYRIQTLQPAKASDFMMREGVWEGGEQLGPNEPVAELLKHGTLSLGFIGLAECMTALYGRHHGQDPHVHREALNIIRTMREFCDRMSEQHNLNITLFATPAEGLSGKFTKIDRERYGIIPGVNDREYYTNSFHIPVYHTLPAYRKIELEAPFHTLCNAGAISYVELDGNVRANTAAFLRIVQYALAQDIGYFSINHPIDRCPACGYEGVIGDVCPSCEAHENHVHFQRLRRVTGYLTGDYKVRFNAAKQAEVRDRVKHR